MDQNQRPNVNPYSANNTTYGYQQPPQYQPPAPQPVDPDTYTGDPKFKPLGAWAMFGYQLLFTCTPVGWIFAIIFSFNDGNICRRNLARSYWCGALIGAIIGVLTLILFLVLGISLGRSGMLNDLARYFR